MNARSLERGVTSYWRRVVSVLVLVLASSLPVALFPGADRPPGTPSGAPGGYLASLTHALLAFAWAGWLVFVPGTLLYAAAMPRAARLGERIGRRRWGLALASPLLLIVVAVGFTVAALRGQLDLGGDASAAAVAGVAWFVVPCAVVGTLAPDPLPGPNGDGPLPLRLALLILVTVVVATVAGLMAPGR